MRPLIPSFPTKNQPVPSLIRSSSSGTQVAIMRRYVDIRIHTNSEDVYDAVWDPSLFVQFAQEFQKELYRV